MTSKKFYYLNMPGFINDDWREENKVIGIIREGCGEDYGLEDSIILYIKLGPNYTSIVPEISDSCFGYFDRVLVNYEAAKSNWKERLNPRLMTKDKDFILQNFKNTVESFNEACRNFGSEEEYENNFKQLFIASCYVRDILKDNPEELKRIFDNAEFFHRCFPEGLRHIINSEMKFIENKKNLKIERRKMSVLKIQVPKIKSKHKGGNGNHLMEDKTKTRVYTREECINLTINNHGKFYTKNNDTINLKFNNSVNQKYSREISTDYLDSKASLKVNSNISVIILGFIVLLLCTFKNFHLKKFISLVLLTFLFLGMLYA